MRLIQFSIKKIKIIIKSSRMLVLLSQSYCCHHCHLRSPLSFDDTIHSHLFFFSFFFFFFSFFLSLPLSSFPLPLSLAPAININLIERPFPGPITSIMTLLISLRAYKMYSPTPIQKSRDQIGLN